MLRGMMIALAPLLPTAALAQAVPRSLGEEWVGADGNRRMAKIGLWFLNHHGADPALVRRLEINWRDFPYQKGPFPVSVSEEDARAELRVVLELDATGVPRACRIGEASGIVAYDAAACPHLLQHLRFYPALTTDGTRVGGTLVTRVTYTAGRLRAFTPGGTVPMLWRPTPKPLKPIDPAAVGFGPKDGLPASVGGVSGSLKVETDGTVSACTLAAPTQDDRFDLSICERLRAWKFAPALDRDGKVVASEYSFGVARR